jgi:hypothetical protein
MHSATTAVDPWQACPHCSFGTLTVYHGQNAPCPQLLPKPTYAAHRAQDYTYGQILIEDVEYNDQLPGSLVDTIECTPARKEPSQMLKAALTALVIAWTWVNAEGSTCFTDKLENVPAKYRAEAHQIELGPLGEYAKLTVDQTY